MVAAADIAPSPRTLGYHPESLRSHLKREGILSAKAADAIAPGDVKTFTLDNLRRVLSGPRTAPREAGAQTEEWRITNVKVCGGHWATLLTRARRSALRCRWSLVHQTIKLPQLETDAAAETEEAQGQGPSTAFILSDQHCPHIDATAHKLVLPDARRRAARSH